MPISHRSADAVSVSAFACRVVDAPWGEHETTINARTAGQAKVEYWRDVTDAWPSIPYTAVRVRKLGKAVSSEAFLRVARYRNLPHARCGDRVVTTDGKHKGVIVGHNSSANFDILFDADDTLCPNQVGNVHPHELRIVPAEG